MYKNLEEKKAEQQWIISHFNILYSHVFCFDLKDAIGFWFPFMFLILNSNGRENEMYGSHINDCSIDNF